MEELVLQIYEEHSAEIATANANHAALASQLQAEQEAHRSALVAHQGQIDALAMALRKQTEVLEAHMASANAQQAAIRAEAAELATAFKAQGAAVQATKDFITTTDEKLSAQIEERARAADGALASAAAGWQSAHTDHRGALERVLAWEPQLRANDESMRLWRSSVDEQLLVLDQRASSSVRDAEAARVSVHTELSEQISKCEAAVGELENRWPEWIGELRSEMQVSSAGKASASETTDRCVTIEDKLEQLSRHTAASHSELQALSARCNRLEASEGESQPREARRAKELADLVVAVNKVNTELQEARQSSRVHKQQIGSLLSEEEGAQQAISHLEVKLRQVNAMTDEQVR